MKSNLFDSYSVDIKESTEINELLDYTDVLVEIAKELINYRKKNNLTQKELAEKLNMNQTMISKLESGNYNATFKMLLKISYSLEKNSNIFLEILQKIRTNLIEKENYKNKKLNIVYKYQMENKDYFKLIKYDEVIEEDTKQNYKIGQVKNEDKYADD